MFMVKTHANVYTDLTITFPLQMDLKYYMDIADLRFMEHMMPDKVWYGSEFPAFLPYSELAIDRIRQAPLGAGFKRKLLRDNAENFYLRRGAKK